MKIAIRVILIITVVLLSIVLLLKKDDFLSKATLSMSVDRQNHEPLLDEYNSLNEVFSKRDAVDVDYIILLEKENKSYKEEVDFIKLQKLERLKERQALADRKSVELALERDKYESEMPLITKEGHLSLLGRIAIASINVNMPLVEGTSASDIAISAGHLENTAYPGHIGNSVIAGHRGYNYGLLFNRLDELEKGDRIVLTTSQGTFTYEVYQKKIVVPEDTSVINQTDTHRVLTLITCEPLYKSTYRLVIHAVLVE
ncbi:MULTISPECIES: sortase [unclassified Fusibacter]|uniref:sortase n=1 Tax=unclassified Fusibacter TaxID=2624464 RepID=UPI001012FB67|nr:MULTISPECIES: class D sortase [unclassified Fusibacter]MCK8061459.1 class D sortase [Fusibacter sp. A2]NPE23646.1 class D sortase [Fusibacter sp. A1]RXV58918.1 class D sortase [Fusibacter sp. A1]